MQQNKIPYVLTMQTAALQLHCKMGSFSVCSATLRSQSRSSQLKLKVASLNCDDLCSYNSSPHSSHI